MVAAVSHLIDNFGNDLGTVVEVDWQDSADPDLDAYMVYVRKPVAPSPAVRNLLPGMFGKQPDPG